MVIRYLFPVHKQNKVKGVPLVVAQKDLNGPHQKIQTNDDYGPNFEMGWQALHSKLDQSEME